MRLPGQIELHRCDLDGGAIRRKALLILTSNISCRSLLKNLQTGLMHLGARSCGLMKV